jgi:hypothetical protein
LSGIAVKARRSHSKASETYVDAVFQYGTLQLEWSIPIEYRRTGTHLIDDSEDEILDYLEEVYAICNPENWESFRKDQESFWTNEKPNAGVTKAFYDVLQADFQWKSVKHDMPVNPNTQRRIQDLKEFGYTIATDTARVHRKSGEKTTHHLLLPLPRFGITGYETWSPSLRARIVKVLKGEDVYELRKDKPEGLLPDHKFPEIRWDVSTKRDSLENLSDDEIRRDFQLITNQRNQQKREACRSCVQTGVRPSLFGVDFFAEGGKRWPEAVPIRGKKAETGCQGCGWYDIAAWRMALNQKVSDTESESEEG